MNPVEHLGIGSRKLAMPSQQQDLVAVGHECWDEVARKGLDTTKLRQIGREPKKNLHTQ